MLCISTYLNKNENAAVTLVSEGLATVHSFSEDSLPWAKQLYDAEVGRHAGPKERTIILTSLRGARAHQCCSRLRVGSHAPLRVLGYPRCELAMELELDHGRPGVSLARARRWW